MNLLNDHETFDFNYNENNHESNFYHELIHFINFKFILKCRKCNKNFFSNNKLHKHMKTSHKNNEMIKSKKN